MAEFIMNTDYIIHMETRNGTKYQELVRCKDCDYYDDAPTYKDGFCDKIEMCVQSNWFCADGKREE